MEMEMKCKHCGVELEQGAKFCGKCGTVAEEKAPEAAEAKPAAGETEPAGGEKEAEGAEAKSAKAETEAEGAEAKSAKAETVEVKSTVAEPEPAMTEPAPKGMENKPESVTNESTVTAEPAQPGAQKKFPVIPAIIGIAAAAVLGGVLMVSTSGNSSSKVDMNQVVYFKEESMMLADLKKKKEPMEITDSWMDEDREELMTGLVRQEYITDDGKYLYYIEDYDGMYYDLLKIAISNPKDATRIDSKVDIFYILKNGNVIYRKKGSYYYHDGKEKLKFGKDARYIQMDEAEKVMTWEQWKDYGDKADLYYQPLDQKTEKVKLESAVDAYYCSEDLTTFYILKKGGIYRSDNKGEKQRLVNKVESMISCDPDKGIFYFVREGKKKLEKNQSVPTQELYYYADGEEVLISDSLRGSTKIKSSRGAYCMFNEVSEWSDDLLGDDDETVVRFAIGGTLLDTVEEVEVMDAAYYEHDSQMVYLLGGPDAEEEEMTLYKAPLTGNDAGVFTEVDSDVSAIAQLSNNGVYYYKDYEDSVGDLYYNGEYLIPDVAHVFLEKETQQAVCLTDYDSTDRSSSVMLYDGKEVKDIADDVYDLEAGSDGSLLLLTDYNQRRCEGDLMYYDGKETRLIDDDVAGFARRSGSTTSWFLY